MAGKKGMKRFGPTILKLVLQMKDEGKTTKEIADYYGFSDKKVIKNLINRHNRKQRQLAVGIVPRPIGRPRKGSLSEEAAKDDLIKRLQLENELLRSFLSEIERR